MGDGGAKIMIHCHHSYHIWITISGHDGRWRCTGSERLIMDRIRVEREVLST